MFIFKISEPEVPRNVFLVVVNIFLGTRCVFEVKIILTRMTRERHFLGLTLGSVQNLSASGVAEFTSATPEKKYTPLNRLRKKYTP